MRNSLRIGGATLLAFASWGCHRTPAKTASTPPPPPSILAGPVMVSVPPPTHRSTSFSVETSTATNIPVVQPVPQPKRKQHRSNTILAAAAPPQVAAAPTQAPVAPVNHPAQSLGKLTAETDNTSAARAESEQVLRTQLERIDTMPSRVQAAHPAEVEQARRFLKNATDSWKTADYADSSALVTKAKVLLDDLLK